MESNDQPAAASHPLKPTPTSLRIWPVAVLLTAMVLIRLLPALVKSGDSSLSMIGAVGPLVCSGLILLAWLVGSRASGLEKLLGLIGLSIAGAVTWFLSDPSMQGPATFLMWTIPLGMAAFTLGMLLVRSKPPVIRTIWIIAISALGFLVTTLLRSDGMWSHAKVDLHWRWTPTAESSLLADQRLNTTPTPQSIEADEITRALLNPEWPGFRGQNRNSRQTGLSYAIDWTATPPKQIWKRPIGPGWSSFAVAGKFLFTQEQRGPDECITCYNTDTGDEYWSTKIETRFTEPIGGPGPRATPQLANGSLYALGANGDLARLDPRDGAITWQTNIGQVADRQTPEWGYSSSPLITEDVVVVHAGGAGDKGILAFHAASGELKWSAPAGDHSYASAQLESFTNESFILMSSNAGISIVNPSDGSVRLNYEWPHRGYRALQPQIVGENQVLIATEGRTGSRLIQISNTDDTLSSEEVWTTRNLKADFNDFVVFEGNIYGFDGGLFACIDLANGDRRWKGGRYGKGQVILLEASKLLFISSERGQGILLKATPEEHIELASTQLIQGKTWNHPVIVGDRLYIRNSQEAACYQLPTTP